MMDPNSFAQELFWREARVSMKDKELRRLAQRACEVTDIFFELLASYARDKPKAPAPLGDAGSSEET